MPSADITAERTEIACRLVEVRNQAIVIADGTLEDVVNRHTGELTTREKWFFLPRCFVEITGRGTVKMPEWLAKDRGLIA